MLQNVGKNATAFLENVHIAPNIFNNIFGHMKTLK